MRRQGGRCEKVQTKALTQKEDDAATRRTMRKGANKGVDTKEDDAATLHIDHTIKDKHV